MPWLDRGAVKSIRYRGTLFKAWLAVFVVCFLILGYLGVVPITSGASSRTAGPCWAAPTARPSLARVLTVVYFLFFLLMPWYTALDKTKPVPDKGDRMKNKAR